MLINNCLFCGKEYEAKTKRSKYCSPSCKTKYGDRVRAGEKECLSCGKVFNPSHSSVRFCSTSCGSKYTHIDSQKMVVCSLCNVEFSFKGTTTPKYCPECRKGVHVDSVMRYRTAKGLVKEVGVGTGKWQRQGDNSTARSSEGVTSREKAYRQRCSERFRGVALCVICKDVDNLHVHHIDHDPHNDTPENLTYLCSKCHRIHHTNGLISTEEIIKATELVLNKLPLDPAHNGES